MYPHRDRSPSQAAAMPTVVMVATAARAVTARAAAAVAAARKGSTLPFMSAHCVPTGLPTMHADFTT